MKTSEMIAMLEKDPTLKFKCQHGVSFSGNIKVPETFEKDWQLVDNSILAWEAIRALQNGRTVIWKLKNDKMLFRPDGAWFFTNVNMNYGKWYIKEEE